jgi:hypothetical protein
MTDGYVYAVIPENLLLAQEYKDRARDMATGVVDKVLDKLGGKLDAIVTPN